MSGRLLVIGCAAVLATFPADAVWQYETHSDKMTGKASQYATVESANSLKLDFPYAGKNHGTLYVRQHPKYGLDVVLQMDKGQLLCRSYDGCSVGIRFDDAPPVRFSASESGDHDPKVLFIRDARRFIDRASKSKRILVQASFYQAGDQVLEFNTPYPLVWGAKRPAPAARATVWPKPPDNLFTGK